jgi:hypothetical protein
MKQLLIFSICFLTQVPWIYAQKVEFTFSNPNLNDIKIPENLKKGDFYQIVVCDINLNNYRVEMQVKDTVYYSSPLNFPVFGMIDLTSLNAVLGTFKATDVSTKAAAGSDSKKGGQPLFPGMDKESIKIFLIDEQRKLNDYVSDLKDHVEKIEFQQIDIMQYRILSRLDPIPGNSASIDIRARLTNFKTIWDNLETLNLQRKKAFEAYSEFFKKPEVIALMKQPDAVSVQLTQEKEKVDKVYSSLESEIRKAKGLVSNETVEKSLVSVMHLYQTSTFTSLPIQFTGEEAEIKMSFIPKDSASNLQTYYLSPIKFGRSPWYWAVGPGMYYSEHRNERVGFETKQVNDSTQNFKVLKEDPLNGEIGVSAIFHVGYKLPILNEFIGIHGSVGTGVSLSEEIKARMLYGGGIAFGKKNHLTLNIGWATGYVDRVSSSFAEVEYGTKLFIEKPSVLVKKLSTEVFYNVGYVFTF